MKNRITFTDELEHISIYVLEQPDDQYDILRQFIQAATASISFLAVTTEFKIKIERVA